MKKLDIKRATLSAMMVWVLGVSAFVTSYFIPIMEDPDEQANWVLTLALIPATFLGAYFYFRKGQVTNGMVLGIYMFLVTIVLDACITVPVFIIPYGGDHLSFFGDPGFWIIGIEYICFITLFRTISLKVS